MIKQFNVIFECISLFIPKIMQYQLTTLNESPLFVSDYMKNICEGVADAQRQADDLHKLIIAAKTPNDSKLQEAFDAQDQKFFVFLYDK